MQFMLQIIIGIVALAAISAAIWWLSQRKSRVKIEPYVSSEPVASKPALVLFYATWCGHCKNFEDSWTQIRAKLRDTLEVAQFDESKEPAMVKKYGVSGYPTILFLPRGGNTLPHEAVAFRGNRGVKEVVEFAHAQMSSI